MGAVRIADVLADLLRGRGFDFAVERAVFVAVLHRLFVSGFDRACEKWMANYAIPGSMACSCITSTAPWRGWVRRTARLPMGRGRPAALRTSSKSGCSSGGGPVQRAVGGVHGHDDAPVQGAGGATPGAHGHSKDHGPDLKQMVLAVVLDGEGRPLCTEMLPGNTAEVTVLLPVVDRLRQRFAVGRVCVVADRGMIATATIRALEERGLEYILGARNAAAR